MHNNQRGRGERGREGERRRRGGRKTQLKKKGIPIIMVESR